jgi:hypothetical protein
MHPPKILLIRGRAALDVVDGIPDEYLQMNGSYEMTPEQRVEWEAEIRSLYDDMVRIVVSPTWAKLIDFETTLPSAVEELVRRREERQRSIAEDEVEVASASCHRESLASSGGGPTASGPNPAVHAIFGRPRSIAAVPPYGTICSMARTQTLVQLSDDLLSQLDARAAREGRSRSDLIREAVTGYLAADREAEIDRRIVEAYTRQPQEDVGAEWAARRSIAAEPWETA